MLMVGDASDDRLKMIENYGGQGPRPCELRQKGRG